MIRYGVNRFCKHLAYISNLFNANSMRKSNVSEWDPITHFGHQDQVLIGSNTYRPHRTDTAYLYLRQRAAGFGRNQSVLFYGIDPIEVLSTRHAAFWKKVHSQANAALTLVDHKSTYGMIKTRTLQLAAGFRLLLDFDRDPVGTYKRWCDHLDKSRKVKLARSRLMRRRPGSEPRFRRSRRIPKDLSSLWLETQFGWAPLLQDISDCYDVLTQDVAHPDPIRVSARKTYVTSESYSLDASAVGGPEGVLLHFHRDHTTSLDVRQMGTVMIRNHDLALANSLGLVNLPYVLWDAVPFSFVADWFLPFGEFLKQQTLDYGFEVTRPNYSARWHSTCDVSDEYTGYPITWGTWASGFMYERLPYFRLTAPTFPTLVSAKQFKGSAWMCATSVALLLQQLGKLRR